MVHIIDPDRILTNLYFIQRGKSTAASHRIRNARGYSEEAEMLKLRSLEEEDYKVKIAPVLAYFLNQLVRRNDKVPAPHRSSNVCPDFNAQSPPEISIESYLLRITKYTPCSPECFLIALIYLDQIIQDHNLLLTSLNVHRFLITSILVAAKLYDETTYNNKYYAHVGGVPLNELNALELKFIVLLNFELNVSAEIFDYYRFQTELQIVRAKEPSNAANESEEKESVTKDVPTHHQELKDSHHFISKRLRRSRSFTNMTESGIFKWRKRRSSSFNVLAVN